MRYPTRADQSDTTVVSNDRRRQPPGRPNESRPRLQSAPRVRVDRCGVTTGNAIKADTAVPSRSAMAGFGHQFYGIFTATDGSMWLRNRADARVRPSPQRGPVV